MPKKKNQKKQHNYQKKKYTKVLKKHMNLQIKNLMEISFTSPGWISSKKLKELKLDIPNCGACLSNMAIAPDGEVVPCQVG